MEQRRWGRLPTRRVLSDRYEPPNGGQFGLFVPSVQGCDEPLKCPEFPAWGLSAEAATGTAAAATAIAVRNAMMSLLITAK
jgi:hypothetical protein